MNKGCIAYFGEGLKTAKNTFFKNKKNFFKYYLYLMASVLGSIFIVTMPIFFLANVRLAKIAKEKNEIEVLNSLEGADHPKRWWTLLVTNYLWEILVIAGAAAIALCVVPTVPFISSLAFLKSPIAVGVFTYLILFVLYVVLYIYLIIASLHFKPVNYIIDKDENLGVSEVLKTSYRSMNKDGKVTYFLIDLLYGIICGAVFFLLGIFLIVLILLGSKMPAVGGIILSIFTGLLIAVILFFLPFFTLGHSVSMVSLFDDVIQMEDAETITTEETKQESKEDLNKEDVELSTDELLESLFKAEE